MDGLAVCCDVLVCSILTNNIKMQKLSSASVSQALLSHRSDSKDLDQLQICCRTDGLVFCVFRSVSGFSNPPSANIFSVRFRDTSAQKGKTEIFITLPHLLIQLTFSRVDLG